MSTPAKVYLVSLQSQSVMDSTVVRNSEFQFRGNVEAIIPAILFLDKQHAGYKASKDGKALFLEAGVISVTSNNEFLNVSTVTGTPTNDDKIAFSKIGKLVEPVNEKIAQKRKAASREQQQFVSFQNEMAALEREKIEILKIALADFVAAHPNSLISLRALTELSDFEDYDRINSLYSLLTESITATADGKRFAEKLAVLKRVSIGSVAPELTLPDTTGKPIRLSSFRGKFLLVDVWAAWCGPCRKENPNQVRIFNDFKHQPFAVLGVSLDTDKKDWLNAIHKDGLPWTQVSDLKGWKSAVVEIFSLNSIPQNYLIDPNGVIVAKNLQGRDLHNKLTEIFGK